QRGTRRARTIPRHSLCSKRRSFFVCRSAVPVQLALLAHIRMEASSNAPDVLIINAAKWAFRLGKTIVSTRRVNRSFATFTQRKMPLDADASNPALQLAQHELADDVHAGIAVVQARNGGKLLAAIVPEYLGVLLRDLFQRLPA